MQPPRPISLAISLAVLMGAALMSGCRGDGDPEVWVGFSVHLESWDLRADEVVRDYLGQVDATAAVFEEHGGLLSLEGGEVVPRAAELGDGTLAALAERGHAIGIHADMSQGGDAQPYEAVVSVLENFQALLGDIGVEATHVSGVCSDVDWVAAAAEVGLEVVSGATLWCAGSLSPELQPPELADCGVPADCHWPWPGDATERLKPWRMGGGDDWIVADPDGPVVMVPTATGLTCNAEVAEDPNATVCTLSEEDIDLWFEDLDAALAEADGDLTILKGTFSLGPTLDPALLEDMLDRLKPYVRKGKVGWATVPEMVARFEEQE